MEQIHITTKDVSPKFFEDFTKSQIVGFQKDGTITHYKIVRMNRSKKTATLKETKLYTEEEMNAKTKEEVNEIITGSK